MKKIEASLLHKIWLVILDALSMALAGYAALALRFRIDGGQIPPIYAESVKSIMLFNIIFSITIFAFLRLYSSLWRYASLTELVNILIGVGVSVVFSLVVCSLSYKPMFRSYYIFYGVVLAACLIVTRFGYRVFWNFLRGRTHGAHMRRTMIIGAGEAGNTMLRELTSSDKLDAKVCCIIDDDERKHNTYIRGVKIVGGREKILDSVRRYQINEIIIAMPSAPKKKIREIVEICQQADCDLKILPGLYQLVTGEVTTDNLRKVQIEDLLGREPVKTDLHEIMSYVRDRTVLVTGGGGSIGSELCRQVASYRPSKLIILDIYENNAYDIQQELKKSFPELDLVVLIGSVRNTHRMESIFEKYRPEIVYHAAAHKHVPLMEDSPNEAIKNNVFGTFKTAAAADKYGAKRFVLISTDKAVNPTNIMGASKRMCEMVIQMYARHSKTIFTAVRFGNVLGSNGSVIPLFKKQIEEGGPVTVTHPDIIRYFMTIPEAVSLVLQAGAMAKGGEIFVLDMGEPVKIVDLAENLIRLSGLKVGEDIQIEFTGLRPGEKLYEELLMAEEGLQKTENQRIFIGKPIEFDDDTFRVQLDNLKVLCNNDVDGIKDEVSRIVPTYRVDHENEGEVVQ